MNVKDKRDILARMPGTGDFVLELGCGNRKRISNSIGIDMLDYDAVDIVGDAVEILSRFPDRSVKEVYSHHFFEHVANVPVLMDELERVMVPGGKLKITVPHFSNPYFFSDLTHKTPFGLYSFSYFAQDELFRRRVPTYKRGLAFELTAVDLIFKSARVFVGRYAVKRLVGYFFNMNRWTKEFYEENLCYLFPCYEIRYELVRRSE
jgi:SAM-dependent methyltransferase